MEAAAHREMVRLFGSQASQPGFHYMSMHMRLGGMEKEKELRSSKGGRNGPLMDLVQGITCIQKKGESRHASAQSAAPSKLKLQLTFSHVVMLDSEI
jgi:hypothetical protein